MDKFSITLTLNEWNAILAILVKQPYEVSAALIQQIQAQAQQQANQSAQQAQVQVPLNGTGESLRPIGPAPAEPEGRA